MARASVALVNDDTAEGVEVTVRSFPEASRMFTHHENRLRSAEAVTRPVHKIWAALKWGWIPGAVLLITGASPGSPLGRLVQWFTTELPQ